jgi:hypothetical protein
LHIAQLIGEVELVQEELGLAGALLTTEGGRFEKSEELEVLADGEFREGEGGRKAAAEPHALGEAHFTRHSLLEMGVALLVVADDTQQHRLRSVAMVEEGDHFSAPPRKTHVFENAHFLHPAVRAEFAGNEHPQQTA